MPSLEDVRTYLAGVLMLVRNRAEGFQRLDISADGFWNSFWAIGFALPALALSWASYRVGFLQAGGDAAGAGFFLRIAVIDILSWVLPIVLLAGLAGPLGIARHFARLIIATNWLTMAVAYLIAAPSLIALLLGGVGPLVVLLSLITMLAAIFAFFRIARLSLEGDAAMAVGITAAMVLVSFFVTGGLQDVMGVVAP